MGGDKKLLQAIEDEFYSRADGKIGFTLEEDERKLKKGTCDPDLGGGYVVQRAILTIPLNPRNTEALSELAAHLEMAQKMIEQLNILEKESHQNSYPSPTTSKVFIGYGKVILLGYPMERNEVIDLQVALLGAESYDDENGFVDVTHNRDINNVRRWQNEDGAPYRVMITIPSDTSHFERLYNNLIHLRATTEQANNLLGEVEDEAEVRLYGGYAEEIISLVRDMGIKTAKNFAANSIISLHANLEAEDAENLQSKLQQLLNAGATKRGDYTKEAWVAVLPVNRALGKMTANVPGPHTITIHFQNMHSLGENKSVSMGEYLSAEEVAGFIGAAKETFRENPDQYKISRGR